MYFLYDWIQDEGVFVSDQEPLGWTVSTFVARYRIPLIVTAVPL